MYTRVTGTSVPTTVCMALTVNLPSNGAYPCCMAADQRITNDKQPAFKAVYEAFRDVSVTISFQGSGLTGVFHSLFMGGSYSNKCIYCYRNLPAKFLHDTILYMS